MPVTTKSWTRRRRLGGVAFVCLAVFATACGPGAAVTPTGIPAASTTARPGVVGTPVERLTIALTALRPGYTFDTTLTVADALAARVVGRQAGDASELTIESGGLTVIYQIVPPSAWLQQADGSWVEAESAVPSGDPLSTLLAPLSVEDGSGPVGDDHLRATYAAAALGLTGDDPVTVLISIASNGLISARYETTIDGRQALSMSAFAPAASPEPILAPSLSPPAGG